MDHTTQTFLPSNDNNDPTYPKTPPRSCSVKSCTSTKSATQFSTITSVSSVPIKAKQHLTRLAPDGERCLITLHSDPLKYCHLIARRTDEKKQRLIEAAWGMKTGEFYFHAPQNTFWLKDDLYTTFDHYKRYLVPTEEDLQKVIDFNDGKRMSSHFLTAFPQATWEYHFLPTSNLRVAITRFGYEPTSFETYMRPYTGFPSLRSQLHLFYVIYNVGEKVYNTLDPEFNSEGYYRLPEDPSYRPLLEKCKTLYLSWVGSSLGTPDIATQPLPQPGTSTSRSDNQSQAVSGTRYWANLDDWVASVKSCASNLGPQSDWEGAEQAKQSLVEYRHEAAREPPRGSWERWIPEHEF